MDFFQDFPSSQYFLSVEPPSLSRHFLSSIALGPQQLGFQFLTLSSSSARVDVIRGSQLSYSIWAKQISPLDESDMMPILGAWHFLPCVHEVKETCSANEIKMKLILGMTKIQSRERVPPTFLMVQFFSLSPSTLKYHDTLQYASVEFLLRLKVV